MRNLQVVGLVPLYPWSVRSFGRGELDRLVSGDTANPWSGRLREPAASSHFFLIQPAARLFYNANLPYGYNEYGVWQGRGITAAIDAGVGGQWGPLSLVVAPTWFRSENRAFGLQPTGYTGRLQFADPYDPILIDLPQRFGTSSYGRLDPGQSSLRADVSFLSVGASTGNEYWGPAVANPILLGNNAAGFPHLFAGTNGPVRLGPFDVNGRLIWGRMDQTAFSPDSVDSHRFMPGVVGTISPHYMPGLEIGGGRLFHIEWPATGLSLHEFLRPISNPFESSQAAATNEADNQLLSLFARWVLPQSGFEFYGEFGKDDHNANVRDVAVEPEHESAYMLGLGRVWRRDSTHLTALRFELLNARLSLPGLIRGQEPFYTHATVTQGHTEFGQVLGSPGAFGGGAFQATLDRYARDGRWSIQWSRLALGQPNAVSFASQTRFDDAFTVQREFRRGGNDLTVGATQVIVLNRSPGVDVLNSRLTFSLRPW